MEIRIIERRLHHQSTQIFIFYFISITFQNYYFYTTNTYRLSKSSNKPAKYTRDKRSILMGISDYRLFDEHDLLIRLKQKDALAFQEIYDCTWKVLYTAAFKRLRNRETCQDVVHDVYADLWNKCDTREIDNLLPYLHTSVKYKIFTLLAKGVHSESFVEPFEAMALSYLDADTSFRGKEMEELVMHWIKALPAKRRTIFQMKFIDNLTTREISKKLSISQKTVQNQVSTTFNELRFHIGQYLLILLILNLL